MTEKEVHSILIDKLNFSQDALYKLDAFCRAVLEYNKKFKTIHDKYKFKKPKDGSDGSDGSDKENKDIVINKSEYIKYFTETAPKDLIFDLQSVQVKHVEKKPPQLFTEGTLVKKEVELGIGRPSTYASIIKTLYDRKYVEVKDITLGERDQEIITLGKTGEVSETIGKIKSLKQKKRLVVTDLGNLVITYLGKEFHVQFGITFTAKIEADLDRIAEGEAVWQDVVRDVYDNFMPIVKRLNSIPSQKKTHTKDREKWEGTNSLGKYSDGRDIYIKSGKFGPYIQLHSSETSKSDNISLKKYMEDNKIKKIEKSEDINIESIIKYIDEFYKYKKDQKKNHLSLGKYKKVNIYIKLGKYGPYIQAGEGKNNNKPIFISMKGYFAKKKIKPASIKEIKDLGSINIGDIEEYLDLK